jgi:hypothetical protein
VTGYRFNDCNLIPSRDIFITATYTLALRLIYFINNVYHGLCPQGKSSQSMKLNTYFHLVLRLRICTALLPLAAHMFRARCQVPPLQHLFLAPLSNAYNETKMEDLYTANIRIFMIEVMCTEYYCTRNSLL